MADATFDMPGMFKDFDKTVHYYERAFRHKNEVVARDGLLVWKHLGQAVDTTRGKPSDKWYLPFKRHSFSSHFSGIGIAIFVLSVDRKLYVHTQKVGKYHHSSMVSGEAVLAAGEMKVTNGYIDWISRKSGHYTPTAHGSRQMMIHIQEMGLDKGDRVPGAGAFWRRGF